jgi:hypothetical protein
MIGEKHMAVLRKLINKQTLPGILRWMTPPLIGSNGPKKDPPGYKRTWRRHSVNLWTRKVRNH